MLGGRYQMLRTIGRGGMGEVFLAEDRILGREVAIKHLLRAADGEERDVATERLLREARSAARIHHRNVVTVHDLLIEGDDAYIVMEYVRAENFAQILRRGAINAQTMARIGSQVASALTAAHRLGIVHRDVKPSNILVDGEGVAKLTDFGVARAAEDPGLTRTGHMIGSVAFMAPEVARGAEAASPADVFSLGATLFAAVEGHAPFAANDEASTSVAILLRLVTENAPRAVHAGPIADFIAEMLAPEPSMRPTAAEVSRRLAQWSGLAEDQTRLPGEGAGPAPEPTGPGGFLAGAVPVAFAPPEAGMIQVGETLDAADPQQTRIRVPKVEIALPPPGRQEGRSASGVVAGANELPMFLEVPLFEQADERPGQVPDAPRDVERADRREAHTGEEAVTGRVGPGGSEPGGSARRRVRPIGARNPWSQWLNAHRILSGVTVLLLVGALGVGGLLLVNQASSQNELAAAVFQGTYEYRAVVTHTNNSTLAKVGEETTYVWQVVTACSADTCQIKAEADGDQIVIQRDSAGMHSEQRWQKDCPSSGTYQGITVRNLTVDSVMSGRISKLTGVSEKKQATQCQGQTGPLLDVTYEVTATLVSR